MISTVTMDGVQDQKVLADAAKTAGVKIFAPSEYGSPFDANLGGSIASKRQIHGHLREIGLPYAIFYTGPFSDMLFSP